MLVMTFLLSAPAAPSLERTGTTVAGANRSSPVNFAAWTPTNVCGTAGGRHTSGRHPPSRRMVGSVFTAILQSGLERRGRRTSSIAARTCSHCSTRSRTRPATRWWCRTARLPISRISTPTESAELWATVTDAVRAVKAAYSPGGVNVGLNLGTAGGRQHQRAPARSRRAALDRRRQLHDRDRQHEDPAGGVGRHSRQVARGVAQVA